MSPLALLSMSMTPLHPIAAVYAVASPVSSPEDVATLFSATFVSEVSKTKISRKCSGAVPLPTTRTYRVALSDASLFCHASFAGGYCGAAHGANTSCVTDFEDVIDFETTLPLAAYNATEPPPVTMLLCVVPPATLFI